MKNLKNYYNQKFLNVTKSPKSFIYKIDKNKFPTNKAEQIKLKIKTKKIIEKNKPAKSSINYNFDIYPSYFPTKLAEIDEAPIAILILAAILKRKMRSEKLSQQYERMEKGKMIENNKAER